MSDLQTFYSTLPTIAASFSENALRDSLLKLSLNHDYTGTKLSSIINTLLDLPSGYIYSLNKGNEIINAIYNYFNGELEQQTPFSKTYRTSLLFFEDILTIMLAKTQNNEVAESIQEMLKDVKKDIFNYDNTLN
jgi:hypothetical protein